MYDNELHFKAVCVVLASLIIIILTKLLYDYWQYRFFHIISWSSSSSAVKLASSWQSTSPHIHLIFLGTVGNYRGLSTGCPESTQNTQKILNTYNRIQTFTWESESGKLTCESFHLWKWKFPPVKAKVEKKCTLKPLLPDQSSLQQLPMQNTLIFGFKDFQPKWLVASCSGWFLLFLILSLIPQ